MHDLFDRSSDDSDDEEQQGETAPLFNNSLDDGNGFSLNQSKEISTAEIRATTP